MFFLLHTRAVLPKAGQHQTALAATKVGVKYESSRLYDEISTDSGHVAAGSAKRRTRWHV
jgi:hypothetical protein